MRNKENNTIAVGVQAQSYILSDSKNTIQYIKKYIGDYKKTWVIRDKTYNVKQVISHIITYIVTAANNMLASNNITSKFKKIVVTCPANYDSDMRTFLKDAISISKDYTLIRIITEPAAAALAYGIKKSNNAV